MADNHPVLVGQVGAPHGVRGQVRAKSFTADPLALGDYGALTTGDGRILDVVDIRTQKSVVVVTFDQVRSREAAEALNGMELFVNRSQLPDNALDEDEFYVSDMIGMDVLDEAGARIGTVSAVENFGAGDLIEVAFVTSEGLAGGKSEFFPFTSDIVPDIDLDKRTVTLVPPGAVVVAPEGSRERDTDPDHRGDEAP